MERRLSAILLTDMVGYSRLIGLDEEGTILRQKAHRSEIIDPAIVARGGRIVKTTGDGVLVEFPSVVAAVQCAITIQQAMAENDTDVPEDRRIQYRIGINLGDIVIDGDDILGDGVNVAARLEGLATPGSICISGNVHDQLTGKLDVAFEDAGEQTVKNVPKPVRVWHWQSDAAQTVLTKPPAPLDPDPTRHTDRYTGQRDLIKPEQRTFAPTYVAVPTTGGVALVDNIRSRPRLKKSYVTLGGDYRPMPWSGDYHHFTSGTLSESIGQGPFELSLSKTIDSGRSWELPVLLAHLMAEKGDLVNRAQVAENENPFAAGGCLVWATGSVDGDLTPRIDDYHVELKLRQSTSLFDQAQAKGCQIIFAYPAGLDEREVAAIERTAKKHGGAHYPLATYAEIKRLAGLEEPDLARPEVAALTHLPDDAVSLHKPALSHSTRKSHRLMQAAAVASMVLIGAIGLSNWSGYSSSQQKLIARIGVEVLIAAPDRTCRRSIMEALPMQVQHSERQTNGFAVAISNQVCALRIRNLSAAGLRVKLDPRLGVHGVFGNQPLIRGVEISTHGSSKFIFSNIPKTGKFKMWLGEQEQTFIELVK